MSNTMIPALRYRNGQQAIAWLEKAFGFEAKLVVPGEEGSIAHAQLVRGEAMIMLSSAASEYSEQVLSPLEVPDRKNTQSPYLIVAEVDALYERAVAAGAEVVIEIADADYGGRGFTCRDPEGHLWSFGSYDPWNDD